MWTSYILALKEDFLMLAFPSLLYFLGLRVVLSTGWPSSKANRRTEKGHIFFFPFSFLSILTCIHLLIRNLEISWWRSGKDTLLRCSAYTIWLKRNGSRPDRIARSEACSGFASDDIFIFYLFIYFCPCCTYVHTLISDYNIVHSNRKIAY